MLVLSPALSLGLSAPVLRLWILEGLHHAQASDGGASTACRSGSDRCSVHHVDGSGDREYFVAHRARRCLHNLRGRNQLGLRFTDQS